MTVKLFGCVCGHFHSPGAGMGMAAERVAVPVPFYVVEHPDGVALFDCGYAAEMADPQDRLRQALMSQDLDISFEPEDLVGPALFLAGDAARFITGAVIPVDGGYSVK